MFNRKRNPCGFIDPPHSNRQEDSEHRANQQNTPTSGVTREEKEKEGAQKWEGKSEFRAEQPDYQIPWSTRVRGSWEDIHVLERTDTYAQRISSETQRDTT